MLLGGEGLAYKHCIKNLNQIWLLISILFQYLCIKISSTVCIKI